MKLIAANFKCNLTRQATHKYLTDLDSLLQDIQSPLQIFPNASALLDNNFQHLRIGAQNATPALNGAFTGEIGLEQLKEFGIESILIGHSERRTLFCEDQKMLAQKFDYFAKEGFKIFYCVGESLEVRESGRVEEFLHNQFVGIDSGYENLVVAYEPIWAIGTGVSASIQDIDKTHAYLKTVTNSPLLYGGSVNAKNASEILALENVSGVLIGSASLQKEQFLDIISAGRNTSAKNIQSK